MHRHDLVWIDPQAPWQTLSAGAEPRLRAWAQARLPFVVARRDPATDGAQLRLGVPLPLAEQRQRLSVRVPADAIQRSAPPPQLGVVAAQIPAPWRDTLQALGTDIAGLAAAPRVFGSFAWQAVTGLPYLHAGSDLDLLWEIDAVQRADRLVARLQRFEQQHALRIDGELRFSGGRAVNWREYASGAAQLLVKSDDHCWLAPRACLDTDEVAA